jgi:hypothetical protein
VINTGKSIKQILKNYEIQNISRPEFQKVGILGSRIPDMSLEKSGNLLA